jgi:DegV family protein with EDD domain
MPKIKIVTDSTVDLTEELIKKYDISVVPLSISINNKTFMDRVDISPSEFIQLMKSSPELPKSSQPSVGQFVEVYNQLGKDGSEIISIHMSGELSGTVRSAANAASMVNVNVTVVDSSFISKALSFQVIEAAKLSMEGKTVQEIVERLKVVRDHTFLYVSLDTLDHLVKGGRIGRGKALIGSLLNIKPIASLTDGIYTPVTKVRSHSQIIKFLIKTFLADIEGKTLKGIGIVHADGFELAQKLRESLKEIVISENIEIDETTPVISTHTGPGAVALMFYAE